MMCLGELADIRWWYRFLVEECALEIGHDWVWAWHENAWAVEFLDPRSETYVRLKLAQA